MPSTITLIEPAPRQGPARCAGQAGRR